MKHPQISSMSNHFPDFYQSILEAAERGELWGTPEKIHLVQLELDLNSCLTS